MMRLEIRKCFERIELSQRRSNGFNPSVTVAVSFDQARITLCNGPESQIFPFTAAGCRNGWRNA
jgi:hypothetical protein